MNCSPLTHVCGNTQGLSWAATSAFTTARAALDLDPLQPEQGLPLEQLVAAQILAAAFLCSGQGLAKVSLSSVACLGAVGLIEV